MATVKRVISPDEWKKRQLETLRAVGRTNYIQGISAPKADPIERAKATDPKWKANLRKAMEEDRRLHALEKTSMNEWYKYAHDIGADKLVDGVIKREAKVSAFIQAWHPLLTEHLAKIDALPEETDADREKRMLENLRGLKALKGKA
ncbi:MAG: hypothetical protein DRO40_11330 [Thermoprotei archaeon]|nr:MAG: hypothetical protein DRO40_11330 [Thermoprotei archaeon]